MKAFPENDTFASHAKEAKAAKVNAATQASRKTEGPKSVTVLCVARDRLMGGGLLESLGTIR